MKEITLNLILKDYLSELTGIRLAGKNTITAYTNDLNQFFEFCDSSNKTALSFINEKLIRSYVMYLGEKEYNKSSISRKLSSLRGMFDYALRKELISTNPIKQIPNPKTKRKLPDVVNVDAYLKILKILDEENETVSSLRKKCIFELLYGSALRVSEVCNLKLIDVDFSDRSLRITGKGSKTRIVPVGTKSIPILREYLNYRRSIGGVSFLVTDKGKKLNPRYIYGLVRSYLEKVSDIEKKSPHVLRHSAATHMLDKGADLMAIKEILGHENLSTTQIYTHVSIEQLKKTYKSAHPKS